MPKAKKRKGRKGKKSQEGQVKNNDKDKDTGKSQTEAEKRYSITEKPGKGTTSKGDPREAKEGVTEEDETKSGIITIMKDMKDEFFLYPVTVSTQSVIPPNSKIALPAITICNANAIRNSYFTAHATDSFVAAYLNYTSNEDNAFLPVQFQSDKMLSGAHQLNDMVVYCRIGGRSCIPSDWTTFPSERYGACYTLLLRKSEYQAIPGPSGGVELFLDPNSSEYPANNVITPSILISLADQDAANAPQEKGYMDTGVSEHMVAGTRVDIHVGRNTVQYMPAPYGNCLESDIAPGGFQQYSTLKCQAVCVDNYIETHCGCRVRSLFNAPDAGKAVTYCSASFKSCVTEYKYKVVSGSIECKCPAPCIRRGIMQQLSATPLTLQNQRRFQNLFPTRNVKEHAILNAYFTEIQYTETSTQAKWTLYTILGSVGGNIGLLVGMSVMSVFEWIETIIEILVIYYFGRSPNLAGCLWCCCVRESEEENMRQQEKDKEKEEEKAAQAVVLKALKRTTVDDILVRIGDGDDDTDESDAEAGTGTDRERTKKHAPSLMQIWIDNHRAASLSAPSNNEENGVGTLADRSTMINNNNNNAAATIPNNNNYNINNNNSNNNNGSYNNNSFNSEGAVTFTAGVNTSPAPSGGEVIELEPRRSHEALLKGRDSDYLTGSSASSPVAELRDLDGLRNRNGSEAATNGGQHQAPQDAASMSSRASYTITNTLPNTLTKASSITTAEEEAAATALGAFTLSSFLAKGGMAVNNNSVRNILVDNGYDQPGSLVLLDEDTCLSVGMKRGSAQLLLKLIAAEFGNNMALERILTKEFDFHRSGKLIIRPQSISKSGNSKSPRQSRTSSLVKGTPTGTPQQWKH